MKKSKSLLFVTCIVYLFLIGPLLIIAAASFSDTTYLTFRERASPCAGMDRFSKSIPSSRRPE